MTNRFVTFYLHQLFNGGIERVIFNLAGEFLKRGMRVDLVVNKGGWSPFSTQMPQGLRLVDLGARRFIERPWKLSRYLCRERPHVIISSQHFSNEIAVLAAALAGRRTRVVLWEHTTISVELLTLPRRHPQRLAVPILGRIASRFADHINAVSRGVEADVTKLFGIKPAKITTIYNPVLAANTVEKSKSPVEHPWFSSGQPPVILSIGRLELQKDYPNLIAAFARVRGAMPCRLMILGVGSLRDSLMRQAKAHGLEADVELPGFVDNPFAYLARAKVFVLSSAWEGLPTVLVEALAVGVAVVSTDCPSGPTEILDGGRFGALVPVKISELLAKAILDVLAGRATAEPAGEWLKQFTSEAVAERFLSIIDLKNPTINISSHA